MTRHYTTLFFLAATFSAGAQTLPWLPAAREFANPKNGARGTALYLETFDTGLGEWESVTAAGNVDWKWTDVGPGPTTSTYPVPPLNTTPGWAIIDDDHDGTNGQTTLAFLISPVIDLSQAPENLKLEFDQYFQEWQNDSTFVGISTDGGNFWHEIEINQGVGRDNRPNPERIRVNITEWVATGASMVQIRFRYRSVWDYGWQVDNVGIYELPPYDLAVNYGFLSHTGRGEEYGRIPADQLGTQMLVGAELFNGGYLGMSGLQLTLEVRDENDAVVYSELLPGTTIGSWQTVLLEQFITIPAPSEGIYRATFTATSAEQEMDADPDNNIHLRNYEVNDEVFSLDGIGIHPEGMEALVGVGTNSFLDALDDLYLMNYYPIRSAITVTGIEFELHPSTEAGGYAFVSIFDSLSIRNNDVSFAYAESQIHDITSADVAAGRIQLYFTQPVVLQPGPYYGAVNLNSIGGSAHVRVLDDMSVPQPAWAGAIHVGGGQSYTNGNAYAVRLLLTPATWIREYDRIGEIMAFPNPTEGFIRLKGLPEGRYQVDIMDMTGSLVGVATLNGTNELDLGPYAPGSYLVRVLHEGGSYVARVARQ
jgi:hypothetical protein